eukprot:m.125053 g.125053  ORF g.125053 m.125053 type:complete len:93 (-) comp9427_c1_seq8:256-534(-)
MKEPIVKEEDEAGGPLLHNENVCGSVHLFCRHPPGAYVYFGKLSLKSMDTKAHPLKFTWNLLDYTTLKQTAFFAEVLDSLPLKKEEKEEEEE